MKIFEIKKTTDGKVKSYILGKRFISYKQKTRKKKYTPNIEFYITLSEVQKYINKKYGYVLEMKLPDVNIKNEYPDKVWQLWLQGIENAPEIVKICTDSVKKYSMRDIIMLSEEDLLKYIEIPDFILEKRKKGLIGDAHFSDYIRLCLLYKYGGTWIDATILMTDKMPDYIYDSDFFCFHTNLNILGGAEVVVACNSFFSCKEPGNPVVGYILMFLNEYWKNENTAIHYSFFHAIMQLVVTKNALCKEAWKKSPYYSEIPFHVLQSELFEPYSEKRWKQIIQMSSLHKLSRIFLYDEAKHRGTYLEYIQKMGNKL